MATFAPLVAATRVRVDEPVFVVAVLAGVIVVNFSYLLHLSANERLGAPRKIAWGAVLIGLPIIGALFYWYWYIWRA